MTTAKSARSGQSSAVPFHYNGIPLAAIEHEEDLWLTGEDIGNALGYTNPRIAINKLYKRNQVELDQHSIVVKLPISSGAAYPGEGEDDAETPTCVTNLGTQVGRSESEAPPVYPEKGGGVTQLRPVRVFNEEGVMILTMLSSQPKAAEFRAWAVGVLKAFRHGNLALSSPANRQRLLETCIKESRFGNPVALHTLIQHFGYPESIRREVKSSLLRRALRQPAQVPELVDWYCDTFLPRLRDEIEGEAGVYLKALRNRPPYFSRWREMQVEGARWCLQYRVSDMYTYVCPLAEQEGVDTEVTSQMFTRWMGFADDRIKAAGFERVEQPENKGQKMFRLLLVGKGV
jgi:prophage antirepressor-like protein